MQTSWILPPVIRRMSVPVIVADLPVGPIVPRLPLFVPRLVHRITTLSPSATRSSTLTWASGKAVRYMVTICFRADGPRPKSGVRESLL